MELLFVEFRGNSKFVSITPDMLLTRKRLSRKLSLCFVTVGFFSCDLEWCIDSRHMSKIVKHIGLPYGVSRIQYGYLNVSVRVNSDDNARAVVQFAKYQNVRHKL